MRWHRSTGSLPHAEQNRAGQRRQRRVEASARVALPGLHCQRHLDSACWQSDRWPGLTVAPALGWLDGPAIVCRTGGPERQQRDAGRREHRRVAKATIAAPAAGSWIVEEQQGQTFKGKVESMLSSIYLGIPLQSESGGRRVRGGGGLQPGTSGDEAETCLPAAAPVVAIVGYDC